ncbi:MAG: AMMECR1 domain-containing protein [Bdellovibrionales bacterium]|nr:AMMECR1 domain-containing protein [Bdellovibrionales bacterium]
MSSILAQELSQVSSGLFVSLYLGRKSRGCQGTGPSTRSFFREVQRNAIAAGFADLRFSPLTTPEIQYLSFGVDRIVEFWSLGLHAPSRLMVELENPNLGLVIRARGKGTVLLPRKLREFDDVQSASAYLWRKMAIDPEDVNEIHLSRFSVENWL